ncbi:MAG TPA: GNAT family N-acetyltransferase [Acidimicrobiia bacterium]|nr:GNAT family N-acetyltransferase [Acidimicrobiia bacterium]
MHPLAERLRDAAHGVFPPADGVVEVVPSPGPPCDAIVGFTGHFVVAGDVEPRAVARRMPAGDFSVPFSPGSLQWLASELGLEPATYDALLVTMGDGTGAPSWLGAADDLSHPRVDRASRYRAIESLWTDDAGSVLIVGRGLCGRWEVGYEVAPEHRGAGLGRRLVGAARGLVPAGEPLWAQVAPGNAASMRSTLAAGFVPVAAEVLFARTQ